MSQCIELDVKDRGIYHVHVENANIGTMNVWIAEWPLSMMGRVAVPVEQARAFAMAILKEISD